MRITILQGAFLPVPPLLGGAVEKIWFELSRQFTERGHSVCHISRSFPGLPSRQSIDSVSYLRVHGHDFPRHSLLVKWYDLLYSARALRVLPPADILVTNTFWMPILAACRQKDLGQIMVDVGRMPKGQMRLYRNSACFRANSLAVQQAIAAEVPSLASRIRLIPNPLPFVPLDSCQAAKQPFFLYVGRLHPEKGIELLLRAFRLATLAGLRNWSLRLVGPAETSAGGGGLRWLKALLKAPHFCDLPITWSGPEHDSELLHHHYRDASIFVYPSLAELGETFGIAPLEAMAFGAVPIVSDLACFRDFIEPGINGIVFDHRAADPAHQLARAMLALAGSDLDRELLRLRAAEVCHSHHPSRIADQLLHCFCSMLSVDKHY